MKFLIIFIILICLGTIGFLLIYFDSKIKEYKRNILTLNNQICKLKRTCKKTKVDYETPQKEISIYYKKPDFQYGITYPYTNVYLTPLNDSFIVNRIKDPLKVKITDECKINKETWYFIDLELTDGLNQKGWLKKSRFSTFINKNIKLPSK